MIQTFLALKGRERAVFEDSVLVAGFFGPYRSQTFLTLGQTLDLVRWVGIRGSVFGINRVFRGCFYDNLLIEEGGKESYLGSGYRE